jgi:hypothetical protein
MNEQPYAIMAEFENPAAILQAADKVRGEGFRNWDVFTPFPIHGMDRAMGIKNSKVGWFSFHRRRDRLRDGDVDDLVYERGGLSDCHRRQADVQPVLGLSAVL